jgi:hypothetical protein
MHAIPSHEPKQPFTKFSPLFILVLMEIEVDQHINFIIIFCYNFLFFWLEKVQYIARGCVGGFCCACKEIENR